MEDRNRYDRFYPPAVEPNEPESFISPVWEERSNGGTEANSPERRQIPENPVRKKKRRKKNGLSGYKLSIGAAVLVGIGLMTLPIPFGTLLIEGNNSMTAEDVYRVGGVSQPINILQIDTAAMRENLSHDLRISEVTVRREFPASIRVTIEERQPAAMIHTYFGYAWLDKKGMVLQVQPEIRKDSVPMLTGKKMGNLLIGDVISDAAVKSAVLFLDALSQNGFDSIAEINVGDSEQIIAYTTDAIPVRLGNGNEIEKRAELAENQLQDIRKRKLLVEYVDTNPEAPYFKIK